MVIYGRPGRLGQASTARNGRRENNRGRAVTMEPFYGSAKEERKPIKVKRNANENLPGKGARHPIIIRDLI